MEQAAGVGFAVLVIALGAAVAPSCRCSPSGENGGDPREGGGTPMGSSPGDAGDPAAAAAGAAGGADAAAIDPACAAPDLDLGAIVVDPRCAITSRHAKQLLAVLVVDGGAAKLSQDAKLGADGRVALRLVNAGRVPITLPLSWHPRVQSFTVLAEDDEHAVYELEAPRLEVPPGVEARAHFARIVLPPGAVAVARVAISPVITKRIAPWCDAGDPSTADATCAPPRLLPGHYALYVGQLVADVEAGPPARIAWQVP